MSPLRQPGPSSRHPRPRGSPPPPSPWSCLILEDIFCAMYETSKIKYISYPLIIIIDFDTGGKTNRNKKKKSRRYNFDATKASDRRQGFCTS